MCTFWHHNKVFSSPWAGSLPVALVPPLHLHQVPCSPPHTWVLVLKHGLVLPPGSGKPSRGQYRSPRPARGLPLATMPWALPCPLLRTQAPCPLPWCSPPLPTWEFRSSSRVSYGDHVFNTASTGSCRSWWGTELGQWPQGRRGRQACFSPGGAETQVRRLEMWRGYSWWERIRGRGKGSSECVIVSEITASLHMPPRAGVALFTLHSSLVRSVLS